MSQTAVFSRSLDTWGWMNMVTLDRVYTGSKESGLAVKSSSTFWETHLQPDAAKEGGPAALAQPAVHILSVRVSLCPREADHS